MYDVIPPGAACWDSGIIWEPWDQLGITWDYMLSPKGSRRGPKFTMGSNSMYFTRVNFRIGEMTAEWEERHRLWPHFYRSSETSDQDQVSFSCWRGGGKGVYIHIYLSHRLKRSLRIIRVLPRFLTIISSESFGQAKAKWRYQMLDTFHPATGTPELANDPLDASQPFSAVLGSQLWHSLRQETLPCPWNSANKSLIMMAMRKRTHCPLRLMMHLLCVLCYSFQS